MNNKKDFVRWRNNGVAFKVTDNEDGVENPVDNITLISGNKQSSGYWGDIMSGPFICYGNEKYVVYFNECQFCRR